MKKPLMVSFEPKNGIQENIYWVNSNVIYDYCNLLTFIYAIKEHDNN